MACSRQSLAPLFMLLLVRILTLGGMHCWPMKKSRRMTTAAALLLPLALFAGCATQTRVIMDPTIPHRAAGTFTATIYARTPGGQMARQRVQFPAGTWIVSAELMAAEEAKGE